VGTQQHGDAGAASPPDVTASTFPRPTAANITVPRQKRVTVAFTGKQVAIPPATAVGAAVGVPYNDHARSVQPSGVSACLERHSASPPGWRPELPATQTTASSALHTAAPQPARDAGIGGSGRPHL